MMSNIRALRKIFMVVMVLSIVLVVGCRGCRERDESFPQPGVIPPTPTVTATYPVGGDVDIPLNSKISATFSTPMVEAQIGTTTFTLAATTGAVVTGTVTYVGQIAVFAPPIAGLAANTQYTATVNAGIRSVAGSTLAENFTWTFTTGAIADTIAPTVVSTNPVSGAVGVPVNTVVAVPFSKVMDPATINSSTFFLTEAPLASVRAQAVLQPQSMPGGLVTGTVSYLGTTAYFRPSMPLKLGTTYTAVITSGAKDLAGNPLAEDYVWSFTGVVADTTAPTIVSTSPTADMTGVAINTQIAVTFSELMDTGSLTNLSFKVEGISGTVTYDPLTKIAIFKPATELTSNKLYTATITTAAQDLAGNAIVANYNWSFTTGATADTTAPTVLATVPLANATNVGTSQQITATFSEVMAATTINGTTFTVKGPDGTAVAGTVTYADTTAKFIPTGEFANSTVYVVAVTTGAKDLAGNALAAVKTWSFTTGVAATTVTSTDPLNGAVNVATNKSISATFSEGMDPATINTTTFTLKNAAGAAIAGTVSYAGTTASFKPTAVLANSTVYTANITTGAKSSAGNAIAAAKTWSFTTGTAVDTIAPTVLSTNPADGESDVPTNKSITAVFSKVMDSATINETTFTLTDPNGTAVAGAVSYVDTTATFKPTNLLNNSVKYTARITTAVKDTAGNFLAATKVWSFTTGVAADITPPTVASVEPLDGAAAVATNKIITANFSETMDSSTINNTTFTLREFGGALIDGSVTYTGTTAAFKPTNLLKNSTTYVANITIGVKDLAGNAMTTAKTWSFVTGKAADTTPPTVVSTDPANDAAGVVTGKSITAVFSESMNSATITKDSFTVKELGGALVGGTVTYDATTKAATFKPTSSLTNSMTYVAEITTAVEDLAGNSMTTAKTWSFTTSAVADTTAPTVASTNPADSEINVPTNTSVIAIFSESMDPATINNTTFRLADPSGATVGGTVTYVGTTATFKPTNSLNNSVVYTARITTGVKDISGNAMAAEKTWSFTTGVAADTTAPTVTSVDPLDGATDVAINKTITAIFSESMDSATINTTTFRLSDPSGATVAGAVSYVDTTATFKPTSSLSNSVVYTARITTGVKDLAGNPMAAEKTWSFTTIAAADVTAPTVTSTSPANGETDVSTNQSVIAVFSENMDPATINETTFTLTGPSGALVGGAVSYDDTTATFMPTNSLSNSAVYTARITTGVKDLAGNAMTENKTWSFTTGAEADTVAPTVTSVDPVDGATDVATNKIITAVFSETMDSATINSDTFTVRELGGDLIAGTVSYSGTTADFTPTSLLKNSTTYVANISVGVKDLAGNAMATAENWSFVTGAAPDTVAPTITSTDPLDDAIDVATNKSIIASFSESMNSATINNVSFTLRRLGGDLIDGTVSYDTIEKAATFKPTSPLANSATYTAEITTAVEDLAGNNMENLKSWTFTTIAPSDTIAPQVTVVYPENLAENVGCKEAITATFDEDMDSNTILQTFPEVTFTVTGPGLTEVAGVVTYVNKVAKFVPDLDLPDNTTFTATIATQAKDLAGNELENPKVWTFTTGQSVPVLGRASSFALMATTKIDGTTGSDINGDVGLSPAGLTSMTLSPVEINGNIYTANDQEVIDAMTDLTVAYDTAAAKATNVVTVPTKDLGGKTFFPGLYKTGDTFDITSGNLTLDAQGNENSVFIFQMPETLTVAVGRQVILINGAKASNVYWQVGSSATLNSTVIFKGNIMANVTITVNDGSQIEGRLMAGAGTAGAGAVTFNASYIVTPAP